MLAEFRVRVFPREARDFFSIYRAPNSWNLAQKWMELNYLWKSDFNLPSTFNTETFKLDIFLIRFQFTSPTDVRISIYQYMISIYRLSGISIYQHNFNFNLLCVQNFNFNLPAQYQFTDCADQFTGRWRCHEQLNENFQFTNCSSR